MLSNNNQIDQKNKNTYSDFYSKRNINHQSIKKSLSTQKSFSKIAEKNTNKLNDENKDYSNFVESHKSSQSTNKFKKCSTHKSSIPPHLKNDEIPKFNQELLAAEFIKVYNDPKMRTKTLPENFNFDCLKEMDFSLEKQTKHFSNNTNLCFKSIEDFSTIKQKIQVQEKAAIKSNIYPSKNMIEIQNLEKFFNKKNEKKSDRDARDFYSPNNCVSKVDERNKNNSKNSNYFNEKERIKVPGNFPMTRNLTGTIAKNRPSLKENYNVNEAQMSLLYFSKINDFEKCLKILTLKDFVKQKHILINFKGNNDWCSLHYASLNGNLKLVDLLLYNEAIIDAKTSSKLTPLMIACQKGHEEITNSLINAGADINLFDLSGNTAIHYGVLHIQKKIVEMLLKKPSINLTIKNYEKKTARDEAISNPEILNLFDNHAKNLKGQNKTINKIVIHNVNSLSISNFLGKHFNRMNAKNSDNSINNISNNQTTATYSSHSNTLNDFSFVGFNEDENCVENEENKHEKEKITLESFNIKGLIGKGSFGEVFLVEKKDTKVLYALKVLKKSIIMKNNLVKYALTERNVLSLTNHPFIVKLLFAFQTLTDLFLIMEYCPGGDLGQHLQREKKFSEERTRIYLCEIILALDDLHKRDIIFRDLKPDNLVLDKEGHVLLTDFGLSKEGVLDHNQGAKSFCGSLAYLAPEMLKRSGHGKAVDWYLLGVVMYEMLVGTPPYYTNNKEELFTNIETAILKIPANLSISAKSLLKSLLQRNPAKRLGSGKGDAEEVKCHSFFKNINWNDVEKKKLKPQIPEIRFKFNPAFKGETLTANNNELPENNYVSGWSFVSPNNNKQ